MTGPRVDWLARLAKSWAGRRTRPKPTARRPLEILRYLLARARHTSYGKAHHFATILNAPDTYRAFCEKVPVIDYPAWVNWLGERGPRVEGNPPPLIDTAWPGRIDTFCLSSGTSMGRTKFIPYSKDMIRINRKAGIDFFAHILAAAPEVTPPRNQTLYMSGSTRLARDANGVLAGDMSALTMFLAPKLLNRLTLPPPAIAAMEPWPKRLDALVDLCRQNTRIAGLSGIPIWQLALLERLATETSGGLKQALPRLRYLIHGGMSIAPYRQQLRELTGPDVMFLEVYAASEFGIAAYQVPGESGMRFQQDYLVFYEFEGQDGSILSAEQLRPGQPYALIISSCAGLWRFRIGDLVVFRSVEPLILDHVTRDKTTSAFDEKITEKELETAMLSVSPRFADFALGPDIGGRRHTWFICCDRLPEPGWLADLDAALRRGNQDYDDYRGDGRIAGPAMVAVPDRAGFLAALGRGEGGQRKFPRLLTPDEVSRMLNLYGDRV